ncbi:MAG: Gfo/Idh/MocA family oxidoreductase [Fimbriimonadaceae bacterium]|nr:Gfo/Idh/MocA family oxidoreductase [Fimbriimonadaceae bacterium]
MAKLRIGLIGLGNISTYHLAGLRQHRALADLSVVCCRSRERGEAVAAEWGCRWTADYRETFATCDALLLATPHHLHYPMARDALQAGVRHLFIEKPVTNTLAECDELIALATARGASVTVGYVLRFVPVLQQLKAILDSGALGPPVAGLCRTEHGFEPADFARFLPWARTVAELGGGVLFSHGCHYVDLLLWMLGDVVHSDCVRNHTLLADVMEGEDSAFCNLVFANGAIGSYFATWAVRYRELAIDLRIYCRDGQLVFQQLEDATTRLVQFDAAGRHDLTPAVPAGDLGPTDGFISEPVFAAQMGSWLESVRSGREPLTGLREGRKSIAAVLGAYGSGSK